MKVVRINILLLSVILLVILLVPVHGSVWNESYVQALPVSVEPPKVILQSGTAGTSTIYTNNTSAKASVVASENWWDLSYSYRKQITIVNNDPSTLDLDYSVRVTIDTASLVSVGKMLSSGNDLRTLYWNTSSSSWVELDRDVIDMNTSSTQVWFKTQASIGAGSSDDDYYMYYGYSGAGNPPSNRSNVYLFWEDFEGYSLGSDGSPTWNPQPSTSWSIVDDGGNKVYRGQKSGGGSSGRAGSEISGLAIKNAVHEGRLKITGTGASDHTGLPFRVTSIVPSSADFYVGQLRRNEQRAAIAQYNSGSWGGILNSTSFTISAGTWYTLRIEFVGSSFKWYVNDNLQAIASDSGKTTGGVGVFVFNGEVYFDDIKTRKYVEPEPSTSAGSEEVTTYDYVLKVVNQVVDLWKVRLRVYDQSNIGRLSNCTIYFYDGGGVSRQIYIYNGTYSQQFGNWYDLTGLSTVYIAMTVAATSTGTSYVYAYLEVLVPGISTYNLMVITFEIT